MIAVTDETSTSAVLLRLILEQRYELAPAEYRRDRTAEADALLLIGDEALRFQRDNRAYPYEVDLAFEWWLWQHLPFVFAVWAIRKDAGVDEKKSLERILSGTLGKNTQRLAAIAQEASSALGLPAEDLQAYLAGFIYRLSQPEEEGIAKFNELVHALHLL